MRENKYYKLLKYSLAIMTLCMMSCNRHSMHKETLTQVETFMTDKPDSAITVLQQLDLDSGDYSQMLLHYAQGRVQCEKEDYPAAIISFLNAERMAKEQNNCYVLGLVYHSISHIYGKVYNNIEQQNYAQKAYDNFVLSGKENYIMLSLESLAEAHYNNKDYDRSGSLSKQLIELAEKNNNAQIKSKGLRLLSNSYIKLAKYEDAKNAILKLKSLSSTDLTTQDYRNLCLAYLKENKPDSAYIYREFTVEKDKRALWVMIKDPNSGVFVGDIMDVKDSAASRDSAIYKIINQNIAQTVANHYAYEQARQEAELKSERMSKFIILAVALMLIAFLFMWYHVHMKAHRKDMEMKMLEAENIRHILNVTKKNASAMQQSVNQLFEQKFKSIDELCNTYYVYQGSQSEKTKIYNNVIDIISKLSKDKKTISELETYVNKYKNNLMADFRAEYPMLKDEEYLLFLYIVVDFSARAISILIGESLPVVYNRKSTLKRKIQQGDSKMKERFLAEFA